MNVYGDAEAVEHFGVGFVVTLNGDDSDFQLVACHFKYGSAERPSHDRSDDERRGGSEIRPYILSRHQEP